MNKKGMNIALDNLIYGILVVLVIIFVVFAIYQGIFKEARGVAEDKLPTIEVFKNKIKELMTSPGEIDAQVQEKQTDEIYNAIKKTIDDMEGYNDCIEEIDFSKVQDKEFVVKFGKEGSGTKLIISKKGDQQEGLIFNKYFNEVIYFIKFNSDKFGQGVGEPLDIFDEFKIIDKLRKISFENGEEKIKNILYKDKWGWISFLADDVYLENSLHLDEKQICSSGKYLGNFNLNDLDGYNEVVISKGKYVNENNLSDNEKVNLGKYVREKDYGTNEYIWRKEIMGSGTFDDDYMVQIINVARKLKFKVELGK